MRSHKSSHIIHKQSVRLEMGMTAEAFNLQNRLSSLFLHGLNTKLEELFDRISSPDRILRIDKLDIDLGTMTERNFEAEFSEKLLEQCSVRLTEDKGNNGSSSMNSTELELNQSTAEALIFFLEHGVMPWYQARTNIPDFESKIINTYSEKEWNQLTGYLKSIIRKKGYMIRRLVLQFSETLLKNILIHSQPGLSNNQVHLEEILLDVKGLFIGGIYPPKDIRNLVWESAIIAALQSGSETDFIRKFQNRVIDEQMSIRKNREEKQEGMKRNPEETGSLKKQKRKVKNKDEAAENEYFVNHCGVIILHPFLHTYFNELGLTEKGKFKDTNSQHRAVLLLHWLATGEQTVAEFELVLPKLICAVDFAEPVPNQIELSGQEKEESESLLLSVTRHWEPLRRTSIEGLRQSFFHREGKLIRSENGWILRVEQKTIDILLNRLPWGIGTIKLPWMRYTLNVEWC